MGIGSVTSMSNMPSPQTMMTGSVDVKSKNIQDEITDIEQQMQKLSSQEELSVTEKADERKKLKREISSLNTELERHQEEFLRAQKRESMKAELLKGEETAEEESAGKIQTEDNEQADSARKNERITDYNMAAESSGQEISSATSADMSAQQPGVPGTVIVKNNDGTVIFKGAVGQEETYGADAAQKQMNETNEEDSTGRGIETADDERDTDTGLSHKEMHAMVSADASAKQADRQDTVIARINGGIAVLKGEINQDEKRGVNTDRKQAELEKLEEKEEKVRILQFSVLGEANGAMKQAENAEASGTKTGEGNNAVINASRLLQEEQASQQRFYVSFG